MKRNVLYVLMCSVLMFAAGCTAGTAETGGNELPGNDSGIRIDFGFKGINGDKPFSGVLEIYIYDGIDTVREWKDYKEMPYIVPLDAGEYSITVKTPGEMPDVADEPYMLGIQKFEVKEGLAEYVEVECTVRNMLVTVEPDEVFTAAYPDWKAELFLLGDAENVFAVVTADDNKPLYVKPLPFGVKVTDNATGNGTVILVETYGAATHQKVVLEGIQ